MKKLLICIMSITAMLLCIGMKQPPEHLNTKQDYLNLLESHPEFVKKKLQELRESRFVWEVDKELIDENKATKAPGYKVIKQKEEGEKEKMIQMKKVEDPHSQMNRLNFTLEEIQNMEKELEK